MTLAFTPDLIVTAPDSLAVTLVAEVKAEGTNLDEKGRPLKQYMRRMSCPVGLLLTPQTLRIYKDRFIGRSEDSIELVGDFATKDLRISAPVEDSEYLLESIFFRWLDDLAHAGEVRVGDPKLKSAIEEYILPAVSGGIVSIPRPAALQR